MKCNKCNFDIPTDAKFCPNCGKEIEHLIKTSNICAKCHTPLPANALFCPDCGKPIKEDDKPQIGDYYYTDGTYSRDKVPNKTVAGIVVSTETTEAEKSHGWTHGWIVATKLATHMVWRTEKYGLFNMKERSVRRSTDYLIYGHGYGPDCTLPFPHKCFSQRDTQAMRNDRDGYIYTYSGLTNGEEYELFNAARQYPMPLPIGKTSGWYVPAVGQIIDMLGNIVGQELKWEEKDNPSTYIKCVNSKNVYDKAESFLKQFIYHVNGDLASSTQCCYDNDPEMYGCNYCTISLVNIDTAPKEIRLQFNQEKDFGSYLLPMAAF